MKPLLALALVTFVTGELDLTDWETFKAHFGKNHGLEEDRVRHEIFKENIAYIEKFNAEQAAQRGFTLGVNQFADLTVHEFREKHLGLKLNASTIFEHGAKQAVVSTKDLPKQIDWRTKGAVTNVKDQAQCGSCWSFSAVGAIEGQHFLKTGKLVSLSEQQLVDCSWLNMGCSGGQMLLAYEYVWLNGGLESEADYPYKAEGGSCKFDKSKVAATISGFRMPGFYSESALQNAVANIGPISVGMDASGQDFQLYKSGIYNPAQCGTLLLDHGVLAVGYGTDENGKDYWLVKNSWSATWGEAGFFKLARNAGNKCGIATLPSYPIVP